MTDHQRAREIAARAMATQSPASGQWPTGALEREIAAALDETIEACAKVAEDGACNKWRCSHEQCLGRRNAATDIRRKDTV